MKSKSSIEAKDQSAAATQPGRASVTGYAACDRLFEAPAFNMVEDYLASGYHDEAANELEIMAGIIRRKLPERDPSKYAV